MDSNNATPEQDALNGAKKIASENLAECCRELVEWRSSTILPIGFVRRMEVMLKEVDKHQSLTIARNIVQDLALEFVAQTNDQTQVKRMQMFQD